MQKTDERVYYLFKNTVLFAISSFGSKLLNFLLVPLYTSVLSAEEYGMADIIHTTATLCIYLFTLDIADSVLRFALASKTNKEKYLLYGINILFKGSVIFVAIEFMVYRSGLAYLNISQFIYLFETFFVTAFNQLFSNYLRAINKIKEVAISGIITTVSIIISNLLFLLVFNMGIDGYLMSIIVGNIFSSLYMICISKCRIELRNNCMISHELRIEMIKYSFPLAFNGIGWWINSSLDRYFIAGMCGIALTGIYSAAYKIPTILSVVQTIFNQAWNLSAIKEFNMDDEDGFFSKTFSCYNACLVIACSVLIFLNKLIVRLLFSEKFYDAWNYTPILLISVVFMTMSGFVGSIFMAVKESKIVAVSTVGAAIINTVLNVLLIPRYGGYGAAIATCISFFSVFCLRLYGAQKYIRINIDKRKLLFGFLVLSIQAIVELRLPNNIIIQLLLLGVQVMIQYSYISLIFENVFLYLRSKY